MNRLVFRSSVGLFALLSSALIAGGCGGDDNNNSGKDAAATGGSASGGSGGGTGGKATGGNGGGGGSGGTTTKADAGRDASGGAGGSGGNRDASLDAPSDVPLGAEVGIDGTVALDGGLDTSPVDAGAATMLHVYVGCADSTGTIQAYTLNGSTAALSPLSTFVAGGAISNSELNDAADKLYVAHMVGSEAKVSTFIRNAASGALAVTGSPVAVPYAPPGTGLDGGVDGAVTSGNAGPQTLTFDGKRRFMAVPNYFSGYTYVYRMADDGTVGSLVSWHTAGSNAHHAVFTLNNDFMLVPYLGSNLVQVYAFNDTTGAITPDNATTLPNASSGPRHIALHGNGKWLYAINETAGGAASTAGSIDVFTVDQTAGTVTSVATVPVPLPAGYTGAKNGGEIEIAPAGDLLFVSMRLDNVAQGSLVSYRINATTGALTLIEQESSHGLTPRQFSLAKDGKLLLVGNQNSATIAVFRVDPATGDMTFVADRDVCASPRFVKMAAVKAAN